MKNFIAFILKPGGDLVNNIVKASLIGIIAGVLFGFTGERWNFKVYPYTTEYTFYQYGTTQAIIGGVLVTLSLFLVYNKKD